MGEPAGPGRRNRNVGTLAISAPGQSCRSRGPACPPLPELHDPIRDSGPHRPPGSGCRLRHSNNTQPTNAAGSKDSCPVPPATVDGTIEPVQEPLHVGLGLHSRLDSSARDLDYYAVALAPDEAMAGIVSSISANRGHPSRD